MSLQTEISTSSSLTQRSRTKLHSHFCRFYFRPAWCCIRPADAEALAQILTGWWSAFLTTTNYNNFWLKSVTNIWVVLVIDSMFKLRDKLITDQLVLEALASSSGSSWCSWFKPFSLDGSLTFLSWIKYSHKFVIFLFLVASVVF